MNIRDSGIELVENPGLPENCVMLMTNHNVVIINVETGQIKEASVDDIKKEMRKNDGALGEIQKPVH